MDVSKTRTIKINMGNYEHWEEFFRVTVGTADLSLAGIDTEGMSLAMVDRALMDFANERLDTQTHDFIMRVSKLTACAESAALDPAFAKAFTTNQPAKATATAKKLRRN